MNRQRIRRRDDESGATAVIVAILAVVLFGAAGLTVDLGNAWARGREVQREADVAALSSGYLLPMSSTPGHTAQDIAAQVAQNLTSNLVQGQDTTITAAQLTDNSLSNGEVTFLDDALDPCTDKCTAMRVVAPGATVGFAFIEADQNGPTSVDVRRSATVRVESALPRPEDIVPFWLPSGCGYGAAQADTSQGNGNGGPTMPESYVLPQTAQAAVVPDAVAPTPTSTDIQVNAPSTAFTIMQNGSLTLANWTIDGPSSTKNAELDAFKADGTLAGSYTAANLQGHSPWPVEGTIGPELTASPGTYYVYAKAAGNGSNDTPTYSTNFVQITVTGTASATPTPTPTPTSTASPTPTPTASPSVAPVGCVGQDRGNFGQLDSPRADGASGQQALAKNLAVGLDHLIQPFNWGATTPVKDCGTTQHGFITGAYPDTSSTSNPPRNCILGDTGNDGPYLYDGLVTGVDSVPGRLDVSNGSPKCGSTVTMDGKTINNDKLSCYLRNGATLADLAQTSGVTSSMLDPSVTKSPRFCYLPVVVATDRSQKNYQPVQDFVPAFITDETTTSSTIVNTVNGLEINGNSVKVLHVFVFNKSALPIDDQSPTVDYSPTLQASLVRLVK